MKIKEQSKGWCCELCGSLIKGLCENTNGFITCPDEDCIGRAEREEVEK